MRFPVSLGLASRKRPGPSLIHGRGQKSVLNEVERGDRELARLYVEMLSQLGPGLVSGIDLLEDWARYGSSNYSMIIPGKFGNCGFRQSTAIWHLWLWSGSAHCDSWQLRLRSVVPTATWRLRLRSGTAHCNLALAVEVARRRGRRRRRRRALIYVV